MYKIGEISKLCHLPVKTLRYYDSVGLLVPDYVDKITGYRYYSASQLAECNRIIVLKGLGFSLDEIKQQIYDKSEESIVNMLDEKADELRLLIEKSEGQIHRLEALKNSLSAGQKMIFNIIVSDSETINVAYFRAIFTTKSEAYAKLDDIRRCIPTRILGARSIIINNETEHHESNFDYCCCIEINDKLPEKCGFEEKRITIPAEHAILICKTDELDEAYLSLTKYLCDQELQITGAFYEFYHEDGTVELKVPIYHPVISVSSNVNRSTQPFVDDREVLGKWNLVDIVPSEEQFVYGYPKSTQQTRIDTLYFLENGEPYWIFEGWTKGTVYYNNGTNTWCNEYRLFEVGGHKLMSIKTNSYYDWEKKTEARPDFWIYEQEDNKIYHANEIRRRDIIDYPFVMDDRVLGEWEAVDFYDNRKAETINPEIKNWGEALWIKSLSFLSCGSCVCHVEDGIINWAWTKNKIINPSLELVYSYIIRKNNGEDYLLVEWKSGDYIFGGVDPGCYVFKRKN